MSRESPQPEGAPNRLIAVLVLSTGLYHFGWEYSESHQFTDVNHEATLIQVKSKLYPRVAVCCSDQRKDNRILVAN